MPQLIAPRYANGSDHGTKRRIIAAEVVPGGLRDNPSGTCLYITSGHMASMGARGFGRDYQPSRVWLRYKSSRVGWTNTVLTEGRIAKDGLLQFADKIDEAFGGKVAHLLDPRETVWVKDGVVVETKS